MRAITRRWQTWIDSSIQRKLFFWSIGFWVISVTILSLTVFWFGEAELTNETRQRNVQLASVISRDVNSQISTIYSDVRTFSHYLEGTPPDLPSQAEAILGLRLSSPQRYRAVYYFDSSGILLLHLEDPLENLLSLKNTGDLVNRPATPVDEEITDTFNLANGAAASISEIRFLGLDNIPVVYIGAPVSLAGENRVAVFEIDLRDMWQRIDLSTVGQSGFTYAVSRNGTIIAHPQPASIGRLIPPEISPLLQGYEGYTEYREPSTNFDVIAAYSPVGGPTGWGIVVAQNKSEANAPIVRTGIFIVSIWLALALLGTFGILFMIRSFTRPIVKLTNTTQSIARTGNLTRIAMAQKPDEVGQLSQAFDQMIDRLQKSEGKLAQAASEERNRLARDLHDAVSQTLFSASLIADVLPRLWERNQPEALKRLEEIRQLTRGALAEMRTLLLELRPASLAEAEIGHLLHQLSESITGRARIPVTVSVDGQCALPTDIKVALYRISQEALNNVAKYSRAAEARVSLICRSERVILSITDNGQGFDTNNIRAESLGLGIMRERAREIGASLVIRSHIGQGTEIHVVWENKNPQIEQPSGTE